jgi:hypothetical protein
MAREGGFCARALRTPVEGKAAAEKRRLIRLGPTLATTSQMWTTPAPDRAPGHREAARGPLAGSKEGG